MPSNKSARWEEIKKRTLTATWSLILHTVAAAALLWFWMSSAMRTSDTASLRFLTVLAGLAIAIVLSLCQKDSARQIVLFGAIGLILGNLLGPHSSMLRDDRIAAILAGDVLKFSPCWILLCAFAGTVIGQNLSHIRILLGRLTKS